MTDSQVLGGVRIPSVLFLCLAFTLPAGNCTPQRTRSIAEIAQEVAGYTDVAKRIIELAVYGKAQNRSYEKLAAFTDTVGSRVSGSHSLERAIKYMHDALRLDGLENVHLEPVKVPHWVRGEESAVMLLPRNHTLPILGLGSSVGTPEGGKVTGPRSDLGVQ